MDNSTLILQAQNTEKEQYSYQIIDNLIKLTPTRDSSQTWELEINIINNATFQIQNIFYPSIPEEENTIKFVSLEK